MGILDIKNCTKRFGGLVAVKDLNMSLDAGRPLRVDRAERRRQDDGLQPDHRRLHARRRLDRAGRQSDSRTESLQHREAGHVADVSEHPAVPEHDGLENVKLARHMRKKQGLLDAVAADACA